MKQVFGIDLRALALFRIALGVLILADLATRAVDLSAHYTDFGVLPRAPLLEKWTSPWHISLHFMSGILEVQALLFAGAAVLAALLIVGWRSRLMAGLSWAMMLSLHARNPMVLQAGDVLFRVLLFWAMLLPLGARWSVDAAYARLQGEAPKTGRVLSVASAGCLLQVCFVYWFTVAQKTGNEWWPDGTAVYYALHVDTLATRAGLWLRQFGALLHWLTYASLAAELLLPFALLLPSWWARTAAVLATAGMHLSFSTFLELGNFPWVDCASLIPFLPSQVWDAAEARALGWQWPRRVAAGLEWLAKRMRAAPVNLSVTPTNQVFATAGLILAVWWNLSTVPTLQVELPPGVETLASLLRLDQQWAMFAPFPVKDDGWFVADGVLRDHTQVDAADPERVHPADYSEPEVLSASIPNQRWRKYLMNLWNAANQEHRLYYAKYLCRRWNSLHPESGRQLEEFHLYFMRNATLPDYQPRHPEKVEIWHHYCFK